MRKGAQVKYFEIETGVALSEVAEELGLTLNEKILRDKKDKIVGIIIQSVDEKSACEYIMARDGIYETCKCSKRLKEVTQEKAWGF